MIGMGTVVLQNYMDLRKDVPDSWSQTFPVSSNDANHFIDIKVEDVSAIDEEEDPLLVTSPPRKADEGEVSCFSVYILLGFMSICLACQMSQLHYDEHILKRFGSELSHDCCILLLAN
jgi:hypothetical protein